MIEHLRLLRNIGQFDSVAPPEQLALTPFTLIYGENGRGKTTLAAILRSLATNDSSLVEERHRLGAQHPPHIVIDHAQHQCIYEDGAWSENLPNLAIFDDTFVSTNVCSGIELQPAHRQSMHELILGEQGVALSSVLQGHVSRVEEHNAALRELSDAIPAEDRGPYDVVAFCNLSEDPGIDTKIREAERRVAAAKSGDAIRQRPGFQPIVIADFYEEGIKEILRQSISELDVEAANRVRSHIEKLEQGGENWVADGVKRISSVSADGDTEVCPFCAQDLDGADLIAHYRAYFSEAYEALKSTIRSTGIAIGEAHSGDAQAAFERNLRNAVETREFWKAFAELPEIAIDTAEIARRWNTARDSVLDQLVQRRRLHLSQWSLAIKRAKRYATIVRKSRNLPSCLMRSRIAMIRSRSLKNKLALMILRR